MIEPLEGYNESDTRDEGARPLPDVELFYGVRYMDENQIRGGAAPALAAHSKDASAPGQTPASSAKPSPQPGELMEKASNTASDVMEKVSDTASEYGSRAAEQASTFITERPLVAVIATGLGCLAFGLLLARR